jgi:hypothetical protein
MPISIGEIIPEELVPDFLKETFGNIVITEYDVLTTAFAGGVRFSMTVNNNGQPMNLLLFTNDQLRIELTELAKLSFDFAGQINFELSLGSLKIVLPSFFKPVDAQKRVIPNQRQLVQLSNTQALKLNWSIENGFEAKTINESPVLYSVISTMIGDSGLIFQIEEMYFDIIKNDFEIYIKKGLFELPKNVMSLPLPDLSLTNCSITKTGFSGELKADWDLSFNETSQSYSMNDLEVKLFGEFTGGLDTFAVTLENNSIKSCNITGELLIPYFEGKRDAAVRIAITLNDAGDFTVIAKSATGSDITLTKEDLIQFHVQSLELVKKDNVLGVTLSGGLEPLLYSAEGMKWPRMDVKNLRIDSTGKFSIEEAWLDLKDLATLDLFGFKLELRKIGLGTQLENSEDKLWIDLSGGLKLIDQVPIGVDVEGFRILWPQNKSIQQLAPDDIGIRFKGVQFSFGVPGAIQLDGLIRFIKEGPVTAFAGDMVLVIPPAGITAEAGLLVGMNAEQPNPYPFFYVYFGLESAAGIPLGQSGLALKGAIGLFGINVSPNRQEGQNWYYDWYKKAPAPGAHQTTKWGNERDALAVGAGVTITTVDGVVKGTKGIIVLALPGPLLVINGKALILDGLNPNPNAEPPFSATAIFDGKEKIVQFNIEAQAEIVEDVVDAYAPVEAFFDFKDITNWHLYLGQDEPQDRRIRANILNVVEANTYLMLDMLDADSPRTRLGMGVSIKPKIDDICFDIPIVGEQCIRFDANINIGGKGELSVQPEQFSGTAFIDAGVAIKGPGIELEIGAEIDIAVEGPSPFSWQGDLKLYADLPDPIPDYEDSFHFELKIPKVEVEINDPLAELCLFSRFTAESKRSPIYNTRIADNKLDDKDSEGNFLVPLVQCDVHPILSFEHEMNQSTRFLMPPTGRRKYHVGAMEFVPTLTRVIIREREKKEGANWKIIYSTTAGDQKPIIGTWLAEADPSSPARPASRRLQLLTLNPLSNTAHSTGMTGQLMMQPEATSSHLSALILEDYPDLLCKDTSIEPHCVDFRYSGKPLISRKLSWASIKFLGEAEIEIAGDCLRTDGRLRILFPEKVFSVTINYCNKPKKVEMDAFYTVGGKDLSKLIEETKKKDPSRDISYTKEASIRIEGQSSNSVQTVNSNEYFECLQLSSKDKEGLLIKSICYTTVREKEDSEINKVLCEANKAAFNPSAPNQPGGSNTDPFLDNTIFTPGMYYEIEVRSSLAAEVLPARIDEPNRVIKNIILDQYNSIINNLPSLGSRYAYFQTDAPPQNLEPYIKWTMPAFQATGVFVNDPLQIRCKRGYLRTLLSTAVIEKYRLQVYLRDANGVDTAINIGLSWLSSQSSTLFPDEETWANYLATNGLASPVKKDDMITIRINNPTVYKPNSRFELLLVGMERSDINTDQEASKLNLVKIKGRYHHLLASRIFTSSRFNSFEAMLASASESGQMEVANEITNIPIRVTIENGANINFDFEYSNLARAELEWYKGQTDYEYGILSLQKGSIKLVSKEALEELKNRYRKERDKLDEAFRTAASALNHEIFFRDENKKAKAYALLVNRKISWLWIKLPESLQCKYNSDAIGSYAVRLINRDARNKIDQRFKYKMLCNADTSQLVFKLDSAIDPQSLGAISIEFTRTNDHLDDNASSDFFGPDNKRHHRYDRPCLPALTDQKVEWKIQW